MAKDFIVAAAFVGPGERTTTNYLTGGVLGFRSWSSEPEKAQRFDTRALAKRAGEGMSNAWVETIDSGEC